MEESSTTDTNHLRKQQIETVLVVDDDESWCFIAKKILQKAGVGKQIITAQNGQVAIKKLQAVAGNGQKMPELIFLDLMMPVMDGFEFLRAVTKLAELDLSQTKIFVCTSSMLSQDQEKVNGYAVAGFIPKPLTQEILSNILT